jgi:hypothetical protein
MRVPSPPQETRSRLFRQFIHEARFIGRAHKLAHFDEPIVMFLALCAKLIRLSTCSAGALSSPGFCFIFAPCGYDEPEILPS